MVGTAFMSRVLDLRNELDVFMQHKNQIGWEYSNMIPY